MKSYNKTILAIGLYLIVFSTSKSLAQVEPKSSEIRRYDISVVIDGKIDAVWNGIVAHEIDRVWPNQTISMEGNQLPTWKAFWKNENMYFLIQVPDDNCYTHEEAGVESWLADKPELYFDVNERIIEDAPVGPATANSGHFQFAPDFTQNVGGNNLPLDHVVGISIDENDANYIFEYEIPFSSLFDVDGNPFQPIEDITVIGFDVTILDLDETGFGSNEQIGRVNWSNDMLTASESWVDMDMSGNLSFRSRFISDVPFKNKLVESINIYPNPSNGIFTLEGTEKINHIYVYDMKGRLVFTKEVYANTYTIDLSNHKAGIYHIVLKNNNSVKTSRILIN